MVGVDEVGRGCLAGPLLVVAARATSQLPPGLRDSKLMTRRQRQEIIVPLSSCCEFGEGWVSPAEIDKQGLAQALRLGLKRALEAIKAGSEEEIIYDGPTNYAPASYRRVRCVVKADNTVALVSAASIYAKVKRDSYMIELHKKYPRYGFERHVGYATSSHRLAIEQHGPIELLHRMSFAPLRQIGLQL